MGWCPAGLKDWGAASSAGVPHQGAELGARGSVELLAPKAPEGRGCPSSARFPGLLRDFLLAVTRAAGGDPASRAAPALVTGVSCQEGSPAIGGTSCHWRDLG